MTSPIATRRPSSTPASAPARAACLLLLCAAALLGACTTNVATGRRQLDYLSREDEIAVGQEAGPQLTQEYGGAITDPAINQYVTVVGMSMVAHTEGDYASLPWKFTLLNSDVINAFALPGGQVFLSRALAEQFTSEAQLAGVLGHEIGHVTAEHADRSIQNQLPTAILATVGGALGGNSQTMAAAVDVLVSASGTYALKFSRDQESEADKLGMRYMTRAGYNPRGMLEVMMVLDAQSKGSNPPEWQSTHPLPQTRIKEIQQRLETGYAKVVNDPAYQTFEARYRAQLLDRIKNVPPPVKSKQTRLDLSRPETWCAHCAEAGAEAEAEALARAH